PTATPPQTPPSSHARRPFQASTRGRCGGSITLREGPPSPVDRDLQLRGQAHELPRSRDDLADGDRAPQHPPPGPGGIGGRGGRGTGTDQQEAASRVPCSRPLEQRRRSRAITIDYE